MESIKDIAIYVDPQMDRQTLQTSAEFAAKSDAHVTGVYPIAPPSQLLYQSSNGVIPQEVIQKYLESCHESADEMQDVFTEVMEHAGVLATWVCKDDDPSEAVISHFRYADVGIMRRPVAKWPQNPRTVLNRVLLETGRPVLILPGDGTVRSLGKNVVIGWNGKREAARAVHDALPVLRNSDVVEVVEFYKSKPPEEFSLSRQLVEYLSHHTVNARATELERTGASIGRLLMNHAAEQGSDLIVTGAWGHLRAMEYMFGGVTRTLLDESVLPLWMSH